MTDPGCLSVAEGGQRPGDAIRPALGVVGVDGAEEAARAGFRSVGPVRGRARLFGVGESHRGVSRRAQSTRRYFRSALPPLTPRTSASHPAGATPAPFGGAPKLRVVLAAGRPASGSGVPLGSGDTWTHAEPTACVRPR